MTMRTTWRGPNLPPGCCLQVTREYAQPFNGMFSGSPAGVVNVAWELTGLPVTGARADAIYRARIQRPGSVTVRGGHYGGLLLDIELTPEEGQAIYNGADPYEVLLRGSAVAAGGFRFTVRTVTAGDLA